jgi:hypothetical protein
MRKFFKNNWLKLVKFRELKNLLLSCFLGVFLALGFGLLISSISATADFNQQINYQGKLTNSNGVAVTDGNYCMQFAIYDDLNAGNLKWQETWNSSSSKVPLVGGLFSALLGTHTSFTNIFNTAGLYLEIKLLIT